MHPYVWILDDMRKDTFVTHVFTAEHLAMHAAEQMVGNRVYAKPDDEFLLYGPGDGTVSVMIRKWPRELALQCGFDLPVE